MSWELGCCRNVGGHLVGIRILHGREELPLLSVAHVRLGRSLHGLLHAIFLHPLDLRLDLFFNGLRLGARGYV